MNKYIFSILLLLSFTQLLGADVKYPVNEISADLKKDVNAVIRKDDKFFKVYSKSRATYSAHFVVTIFNSKGKHFSSKYLNYSKLKKISTFKANVYDASGKLVKKLKPNEIRDYSAYDGYSLFSDNRIVSADLSQSIYPYTVEFEYEVEYKYLYGIDGTFLLSSENVSCEHATYTLIFPPDLAPRYKTFNVEEEPKREVVQGGFESLSWSFQNLKPIKFEPYGPDEREVIPHIIVAPSKFSYEGYEGDMSTWEDYGKWQLLVNRGRDVLPEATKQKVIELTRDLRTTEEKAKAIYEYMQGKTRYVNISLGIGGLQPFEASVVDKTGYGDCKALSNYTIAMLKEVGVKAYYTKIMAGDDASEIIQDFPSHQTNHIIVAVPIETDTLWLECTSQTNPFGYLGTFTGDRKALMVTESGGKIVHTTRYPLDKNLQKRTANVFINKDGNATAKVKTIYSGLQYENENLNHVLNDRYDEQRKWVLATTRIPSFDVQSFSFIETKDRIPTASVMLDLTLNRFASLSGKRVFIVPNLMNRSMFIPEKNEDRKSDIVNTFGGIDIDTIIYDIPENIYPEFLPEPVKITSRFGEYEASFLVDQGKVVYIRKFKMIKGRFPAESYQEFTDFYRSINKADHVKLVFLSKT